jgi:hypothetical protein
MEIQYKQGQSYERLVQVNLNTSPVQSAKLRIPISQVTSIGKRLAVEKVRIRSRAGWWNCQTNALGIKAFVTFFFITCN